MRNDNLCSISQFAVHLRFHNSKNTTLMLKRYFLSNILIMLLLNLLVKPIWIFIIDRNVQLKVGHEEYGLYNALFSLSIIFNILLDFGITNFNNRYIASDQQRIGYSLPNMIAVKAVLSLFYFMIVYIVALVMNYHGRSLYLLCMLAIVQLLSSFLQYLRSNISASHDFKIDSFLSVFDKLLMILVCSVLLFSQKYSAHFVIEWFVYAQIGAYLITIIFALVITIWRYTQITFKHLSLDEMWRLCKGSLPYAMLILLMGIYMRSDTLILERLEGPAENGIYAQAYRILDAANSFGLLFAGMLLSMFSRMISKQLNIDELVKTSTNILMPVSLACVAFSLFYAKDIMYFLYDDQTARLGNIYFFVIACFPAFCLMYIYSTLLTANGNIILLIKIALLGCILSIGLNIALIPTYKALGAAVSAFIIEWILAFFFIYACYQRFTLTISWKWLMKFVVFFVLLIAMNAVLAYFSIKLLPAVILNGGVFLIAVYLVRLWDVNSIQAYFKQYKTES